MNRRVLLTWMTWALGLVCSALVAVPGVAFLVTPLLRRSQAGAVVQRIIPWDDLPVGVPVQCAIRGQRRDAWVVHPDETIGRVWLVRRASETTPPSEAAVEAFTAVCPHLGCSIQYDGSEQRFVCPCHSAAFDLNGTALRDDQLGHKNPAPRGMDALPCRLVEDSASGQWWVEVSYARFQHGLTEQVPSV